MQNKKENIFFLICDSWQGLIFQSIFFLAIKASNQNFGTLTFAAFRLKRIYRLQFSMKENLDFQLYEQKILKIYWTFRTK